MPDARGIGPATPEETMTIVAARAIDDGTVCFVGIGVPSAAANLARRTHAPNAVLIYESGVIGARPDVLPLSIGDGELVAGALAIVSVPEMFAYWLQGGRIDLGFLGAAQIDAHANLNSTVIGAYARPAVRLPGAGGAPEIAAAARATIVVMKQTARTFVERLDFVTTVGFATGGGARAALGFTGGGPKRVVTDLGVLEPGADGELTLVGVHAGVSVDAARAACGWELRVATDVRTVAAPTAAELAALRELEARTRAAHAESRRVS